MNNNFNLLKFLPKFVITGGNNQYPIKIKEDYNNEVLLLYVVNGPNKSKREYTTPIPKQIKKDKDTFQVLGLLQAEMGKTNNGCICFSNCEPRLIKKVMRWFEREKIINQNNWRWYTKVNINEPTDENYKKEIETKIVNYWLNQTNINPNTNHPKSVTYIKNTKNKILKQYDNGTLIIEHKSNLLSQIIKNFLKNITYNYILNGSIIETLNFMKGIIAGEGAIQNHKPSKSYGVHISATQEREREIYKECLNKLGIELKIYNNYKETLISKRENLIKLLQLQLMTLSPSKYSKFLEMMKQYPGIEETGYFTGNKEPRNKIPEEVERAIIYDYEEGITNQKELANKWNISHIKVNRIIKGIPKTFLKITPS